MTFTPTDEQLACISAATDTKDNLLIQALAGAAKTSTLILIAEALPDTRILSLAFNKKIAVEMSERLPANCESRTLNALGHRIWADAVGTRLRLYNGKMYSITKEIVDNTLDSDALYKGFKEILSTAKEAKTVGYIPEQAMKRFSSARPKPLTNADMFFAGCEFDLSPREQEIVDDIITESIRQSLDGNIDFADQIFMPACFRAVMPIYKLVLVDEAQDLSALDRRFLTRLARFRLIAVGDPCQAIYGFRGASENSMTELQRDFSMTKLLLTTSFRCPPALVEHVRWRAPMMKAWPGNPHEGRIKTHSSWSVNDIPDGAAVICRNNAPLFAMAITFLRNGRYPKLLRGDVISGLINLMKKLGPTNMDQSSTLTEITRWEEGRLRRSRAKATVRDQAECMRLFAHETDTLGGAIEFARSITEQEGPVEFMTGHKSKGLEYKSVWFLDESLVADEGQDRNLRYVICTRALKELHYITSTGCEEMFEE